MYYLQSRYYDPVVHRMLNADAIGGYVGELVSHNIFSYCFNNPVNASDSSGDWPKWMQKAYQKAKNFVQNTFGSSPAAHTPEPMGAYKTATNNKLPLTGKPGSKAKSPNGNEREYGADGRAKRDTDYSHPGHHPELKNPHQHDWEWDGNKPKRGPAHNINIDKLAEGLTMVFVSVVGIAMITANDVTGVGVADDFLLVPLGAGVSKGFVLIFGG